MKLKKFRIKNYKSIIDSGYCDLARDFTILVGKNESGKTAILEALRDFDKELDEISENAFPIDENCGEPSIEMCFEIVRDEMLSIQEETGIHLEEDLVNNIVEHGLSLTKNPYGDYSLNNPRLQQLAQDVKQGRMATLEFEKEKLNKLLPEAPLPELDLEAKPSVLQQQINYLKLSVKKIIPSIRDDKKHEEILAAIRAIIKEGDKLVDNDTSSKTRPALINGILQKMPQFIFFSEFDSLLPFDVPVSELKKNKSITEFAEMTNLDLDLVMDTVDIQKRMNILNRHSATISGEFLDYWDQDKLELVIRPDGEKILFGVKEQNKTDIFKIEQRSKGLQWFLSFYLHLNSRMKENNIIIIDEPGLNLHAKAQKEIIKILEHRVSSHTQVIFSTHSPYFIDTMRLDRIRPVIKDGEIGTIIENNIRKDIDKETMTPIQTALGTQVSEQISPPSQRQKNVVFSGISNYYFYEALKGHLDLGKSDEWNVLPSFDMSHLKHLISNMIGQQCSFKVILERTEESMQLKNQLIETFGLRDSVIVFISKLDGEGLESVFSKHDFHHIVLDRENMPVEEVENSEYIKRSNMNKAYLAREFSERMKASAASISLSDETIVAFQNLCEKILFEADKILLPLEAGEVPVSKEKGKGLFKFWSHKSKEEKNSLKIKKVKEEIEA